MRNVLKLTISIAFIVFASTSFAQEYTVTAVSLSYQDVYTAVNKIRSEGPNGHGTVVLPEGEANWGFNDSMFLVGGINLVGQGINKTIIHWDHNDFLISYNDPDEKNPDWSPMRVTGISFRANADSRGTALIISSIQGFRVDHCEISTIKKYAYMMFIRSTRSNHPRPYGVIDHCEFKATGIATYGVYVGPYRWPNGNKDYMEYMGKLENVFIEDCIFENIGHHIALFDGGTAVFRYNTSISDGDAAPMDSHELSGHIKDENGVQQEHGGRFMEVYGNTFTHPAGAEHTATILRSRNGGGVMFNNTLIDPRYAYMFVFGQRTLESTSANGSWHVDEFSDGNYSTFSAIVGNETDVPGHSELYWNGTETVDKIDIYNRFAGESGKTERTMNVYIGEEKVYSGLVGPANEWLEIPVNNIEGDFVKIETASRHPISFYEVEVQSNGTNIDITKTSTTHGRYPGLDQVHFWWIWDNDVQNVKFPGVHKVENPPFAKQNIVENRDYFLRKPNPQISHPNDALMPGFTEPDYTPYTYPHPFTQGANKGRPSVPKNLRCKNVPGY